MLRSVDAYVAPHLGGESFGIVLVEAMAAGAPVVASDLPAFAAVLDKGSTGILFETGSQDGLSRALLGLLADPGRREALRAAGLARASGVRLERGGRPDHGGVRDRHRRRGR